jgi:elongation factor P--(R)-beta-lysine ligase
MPHNFAGRKPYLDLRMGMIKAIRRFFDGKDFYEVETPSLQTMPSADMHIHGFHTEFFGPDLKKQRDFYLHTSPEFEMKKLLVAGLPRIYQICKVYRNGESTRRHSPEFTMLEWYRANSDYRDIMKDCEDLLRAVASALSIETFRFEDHICDPFGEWEYLSVAHAFESYAGLNLDSYIDDSAKFAAAISDIGIRVGEGDQWDDLFFRVMAEKIEPSLGMNRPTILYDYPASMASLSRKKKDNPLYAERFELYVCGVELANAFSELTDAGEQRNRFYAEMAAKQKLYGIQYPVDEDFLAALEYGMPEAGGIALGVDRLAMLCAGVNDITKVLWSAKPGSY